MLQGKTLQEDIKNHWKYGGITTRLILINIGVFLVLNVGLLVDDLILKKAFFYNLMKLFFLPASFFSVLLKPWTYITYAFCHVQPLHLFFNMMGLYFFGKLIKEYIGEAKILPIFIFGALGGAFLFQLTSLSDSFSANDTLIGASAGIMALVVAAATLIPDYTVFLLFFGAVRLKWVALSYVIISVLSLRGDNYGGNIAHIGGAIIGYLFIYYLNKGTDLSKPFYAVLDRINIFFRKPKPRPISQTNVKENNNVYTANNQQKLDAILDKINKSGYESLSKEEKEFLFLASKEK